MPLKPCKQKRGVRGGAGDRPAFVLSPFPFLVCSLIVKVGTGTRKSGEVARGDLIRFVLLPFLLPVCYLIRVGSSTIPNEERETRSTQRMLPPERPDRIHVAFDDHRLVLQSRLPLIG